LSALSVGRSLTVAKEMMMMNMIMTRENQTTQCRLDPKMMKIFGTLAPFVRQERLMPFPCAQRKIQIPTPEAKRQRTGTCAMSRRITRQHLFNHVNKPHLTLYTFPQLKPLALPLPHLLL
jgi:hypothetical protein